LEELGIYDPDDRDNDQTLDAPGSLCMFNLTNIWPVFSSSYPLLTPFVSIDFATYVREARQVILQDQSWEITLDQWIMGLPVSKRFKNKCLYPWISAAIGCTRADAARSLARSILQSFALAFPENPSEKVTTMNSKLGTGGNFATRSRLQSQHARSCGYTNRVLNVHERGSDVAIAIRIWFSWGSGHFLPIHSLLHLMLV